jgi:hypothetical protein
MRNTLARTAPEYSEQIVTYRYLSLLRLAERIVRNGDELALKEIHDNRRIFRYRDETSLLLAEYLDKLRQSMLPDKWAEKNDQELSDTAYDLTIAKFINLPHKSGGTSSKEDTTGRRMKRKGADCRLYFRTFLNHVGQEMDSEASLSQLEQEDLAARSLQGLVKRHFYLSWLEAKRRSDPAVTRYVWKINGGTITLYLPSDMGRKKRDWLEKNVDNPDPHRPGESERIQAIINRRLIRSKCVEFYDSWGGSSCGMTVNACAPENALLETSTDGLAKVIADEKARNIDTLRPSIRELGKEKVTQMILRIFEDLSGGDYQDGKVASTFGLNKSSFSRFAGSQWSTSGSRGIPDLWLNTAHTVASHPSFSATAREVGIGAWEKVQTIVNNRPSQKGREKKVE